MEGDGIREGGGDGGDVLGGGVCVIGCCGGEDVDGEVWLVSDYELA